MTPPQEARSGAPVRILLAIGAGAWMPEQWIEEVS